MLLFLIIVKLIVNYYVLRRVLRETIYIETTISNTLEV